MTAKEFYNQEILPLKIRVEELEIEYEKLWLQEQATLNNIDKCCCDNCAYSCNLNIGAHNYCLYGKCTCCNPVCYGWTPETESSKYIREHYHYDSITINRLVQLFGNSFVAEKGAKKIELIQQAIKLMEEIR